MMDTVSTIPPKMVAKKSGCIMPPTLSFLGCKTVEEKRWSAGTFRNQGK